MKRKPRKVSKTRRPSPGKISITLKELEANMGILKGGRSLLKALMEEKKREREL